MANEVRENETLSGSTPEVAKAAGPAESIRARRPYAPPKLQSLGNVAQLTFGTGSGHTDGRNAGHPAKSH